MNKRRVASCLAFSLAGAELCESKETHFTDKLDNLVKPGNTAALAANPHVHVEIDTESASARVPPLASGSQGEDDRFVLRIRPENAGFRLIGSPRFDSSQINEMTALMTGQLRRPTGYVPQAMYGFRNTIEELTDALVQLGRPAVQVAAAKRNGLAGVEQEIAGHGVQLTFPRGALAGIGMNFRPPDC